MIEVKERPKARSGSMALHIRKIGVIGAGQMGSGIAHVSALAGFEIKLNDLPDRIKAGIATINGNMARQVSRKRITEEERQAALERIAPAETLDAFGDCDLVIEAATEKEDVKRTIFATLCPVLKPDAILGSNTSSISITRLASSTDSPERFIGIHFMNPVPLMELVEPSAASPPTTRPSTPPSSSSPSWARPSRWRRISPPSSSTGSCCR